MAKSVNEKIWKQKELNEHYVSELRSKLGISDFLARILSSRVNNLEEATRFLSPKLKYSLPDPFHIFDMEKAVLRTIEAIKNNQKICIFADYDVDGATSSALLKNLFRELGSDAEIYVPDRIAEGYGPSKFAMAKIKENGTKLLITVDCGAMAHEALNYAKEVGLDVIVIDHHISSDILPNAVAIINPNRLDETSEYKYLAAVGVSFLFAVALVSALKKQDYFQEKLPPNLIKYLDLVALGTVCDVMPIIHLNRVFVALGLKVMAERQNIGLKTLCDVSALDERPNCYHLGFVVGPRINAGGRVGKSSLGARLLSTICGEEALQLASELDKHNNERKVIELNMLDEAMKIAEAQQHESVLFVVGEGWHPGVIGIIAGRLKEKFNKPVAVIALNDNIGKASCRSIKGLDFGSKLIEAKQQELIVTGGGHAMAAGFTAQEEKLGELQKFLNNLFERDLKNLPNQEAEEYSLELTTSGLNFALMEDLSKLEPYGNSNFEPIFKISNLFVLKADIVGEKHIRCLLAPSREAYGSKPVSAIVFNAVGSAIEKVLLSRKSYTISAMGSLKMNSWQDRTTIQLHVKDLIVEG